MTVKTLNKFWYHRMAVADSWYELLEEEACLQFKWVEFSACSTRCTVYRKDNRCWDQSKVKWSKLSDLNLILTEASSIAYPLKELSSRSIFHYNSQMSWCQYDLEQKVKCRLIELSLVLFFFFCTKTWYWKKQQQKKGNTQGLNYTDLSESNNVGMPQWPVVNNFPSYIFIYLLHNFCDS